MNNPPLPHAALLAALNALKQPDSDSQDGVRPLIALVDALRPAGAGNVLLATARFTALCEAIEQDDTLRSALRSRILLLFSGRKQVSFFADSGILPNSGFFSELWRRMIQRVFPAIVDTAYLRDCVNQLFHRRDDAKRIDARAIEIEDDQRR